MGGMSAPAKICAECKHSYTLDDQPKYRRCRKSVAHGWARGPYTAFGLTAAIERLCYRWRKAEWDE